MNPPYASSGNFVNGKTKIGLTETKVALEMNKSGMGKDSQQLYNQFIFRSIISKHTNICMFSPPLFLSGASSKKLREHIFNSNKFKKGFLMDSANFADVKSWGLSFTILSNQNNEFDNNIQNNRFEFDVLEKNENLEISKMFEKNIYNTDNCESGQEWVKSKIKNLQTFDMPQMKSALQVKESGYGKNVLNSLGYMYSDSNNVYKNSKGVCLVSSVFSHGHGVPIVRDNFLDTCSFFCARKSVTQNWINQKDEYLTPNEQHQNFQQYQYDSIVYSLFHSISNQSSLRQITYKEKLWDIKNEFFWMSKNEMLELSNQNNYSDLYNDARTDSDRYVYKLLFGEERIYDKLSPDAKLVLDKATELVRKSMQMREIFANDENHLKSWDAGYAQLKLIWKEYYADEFKEFRQLYKNLEDRMRPLVYELGFLLK
jgi:hypothetical protein